MNRERVNPHHRNAPDSVDNYHVPRTTKGDFLRVIEEHRLFIKCLMVLFCADEAKITRECCAKAEKLDYGISTEDGVVSFKVYEKVQPLEK